MKGKLIKVNSEWWVKLHNSQEIEVLDYPKNLILKEGKEVEFEVISIEDYVGFAGYPTFTTKARLFEVKEEIIGQKLKSRRK
jgi:hypothetical protein